MTWTIKKTKRYRPTNRLLTLLVVVGFLTGVGAPSIVAAFVAHASEEQCYAERSQPDRPRYQGTPPSVVYRADGNGPSTIFTSGFVARGRGLTLTAHVVAHNDGAGSAYVATTEDPRAVTKFANTKSIFNNLTRPGETVKSWIYVIRADPGFFSVEQSLEQIACAGVVTQNEGDDAITVNFGEHEWVAIAQIDTENVQKACPVTGFINGEDYLSRANNCVTNPAYVNQNTRASRLLLTG